jgi:hypothetical protein
MFLPTHARGPLPRVSLAAAEFDEAVAHDPLQLFLEAEDEPELVIGVLRRGGAR